VSFDAHNHLDARAFEGRREAVWARAQAVGVTGCLIAGADPRDADRVASVANALGQPYALGVHPWWTDVVAGPDALAVLASRGDLAIVGETGLDRRKARTEAAWQAQVALFRDHLALARQRGLPVVLHVVGAYPEVAAWLRRDGVPEAGGMVHAWSGPVDAVADFVALGLQLSFGGPVTRSRRVLAAALATPDPARLLESDAPDQPHAGEAVSEPADVTRLAAFLSAAAGRPIEAPRPRFLAATRWAGAPAA
jgi:TatD DNase family protein